MMSQPNYFPLFIINEFQLVKEIWDAFIVIPSSLKYITPTSTELDTSWTIPWSFSSRFSFFFLMWFRYVVVIGMLKLRSDAFKSASPTELLSSSISASPGPWLDEGDVDDLSGWDRCSGERCILFWQSEQDIRNRVTASRGRKAYVSAICK